MFCKIKQSTVLILGQMEMNAKVDIFLPRPTYIGKNCLLKKHIYCTVYCTYYIVASCIIIFCDQSESDQKSIVCNPDSGFSFSFEV